MSVLKKEGQKRRQLLDDAGELDYKVIGDEFGNKATVSDSARELIEDHPHIAGKALGFTGRADFSKEGLGDPCDYRKFSGADLVTILNLDLVNAYLRQLYLENIEQRVLAKINTIFMEYGVDYDYITINTYGLSCRLGGVRNIYHFCKEFITELLGDLQESYLLERKAPTLTHNVDAGGFIVWTISCRYGKLPSVKL